MVSPLATDLEIETALARLPGWHRTGGSIRCSYRFPDFAGAVAFTNAVAAAADELNHHPEWTVRYRTVDVLTETHDAGGLTALDFALAERIHALAPEGGGEPATDS